MFAKPLVAGLLLLGCLGAAAGGAYVAVRQNSAEPSIPAPAVQPLPAAPAEAPRGVAETESVVTPPAKPEPEAQPVERPRPDPDPPPAVTAERTRPLKRTASRAAEPASAPPPRREPVAAAEPAPAPRHTPPPVDATPPAARPDPPVPEPAAEPLPVRPLREYVQVVVPASAVIGLQVETSASSERAQIEDRVDARVTRDVNSDGRVAIPAGSRMIGSIVLVERGGKIKERARLGVRFHTLVFADGTEMPISTEAVYREGESPGPDSARKIGGATVGGAVLGAILGGGKGAVIGGAAGAAGGTAASMAGDRKPATLPAGTVVTIRLTQPVTVEVEKDSSR